MSILSIDFGQKYIGLAVSDPENKIAFRYKTIINRSQNFIIGELQKVCSEKKIGKIIIGLPKNLAGKDSQETKVVRRFAQYVKIKIGLPVELVDERLTSRQAEREGVSNLHEESARLILESYLERNNRR